jgi:hypothetical protein
MKKFLFLTPVLLFLFYCGSGSGDAFLFVEGLANHQNTFSNVKLYTEKTNRFDNSTPLYTTDFYISVNTIKLKAAGKDWVVVKEDSYSFEQELVRGANIVNGATIPAYDYNIVLIGYKGNWWIKATNSDGISYSLTNSTSSDTKYAIFYNYKPAYDEISNHYPDAASIYVSSQFSLFSGDSKWIYLYFDTEQIAFVFTNDGGGIDNYFTPPTLSIEFR